MYFDYGDIFFKSDSDVENDKFNNLMTMLAFLRRERMFRSRVDHFNF